MITSKSIKTFPKRTANGHRSRKRRGNSKKSKLSGIIENLGNLIGRANRRKRVRHHTTKVHIQTRIFQWTAPNKDLSSMRALLIRFQNCQGRNRNTCKKLSMIRMVYLTILMIPLNTKRLESNIFVVQQIL